MQPLTSTLQEGNFYPTSATQSMAQPEDTQATHLFLETVSNMSDTPENREILSREYVITYWPKETIAKGLREGLQDFLNQIMPSQNAKIETLLEKKNASINSVSEKIFEQRCQTSAEIYTLQELQNLIKFIKTTENSLIVDKTTELFQKLGEVLEVYTAGICSQTTSIIINQPGPNQPSTPSLGRKFAEISHPVVSIINQLLLAIKMHNKMVATLNPSSSQILNLLEMKFRAKQIAPVIFEECCKIIEDAYTTSELESLLIFYSDPNCVSLPKKAEQILYKSNETYGDGLLELIIGIFR